MYERLNEKIVVKEVNPLKQGLKPSALNIRS